MSLAKDGLSQDDSHICYISIEHEKEPMMLKSEKKMLCAYHQCQVQCFPLVVHSKTQPHMIYSVINRYSINSPRFQPLTHTPFSLYIPEWKGCETSPGRIYKMHCSDINSCVLQREKKQFWRVSPNLREAKHKPDPIPVTRSYINEHFTLPNLVNRLLEGI